MDFPMVFLHVFPMVISSQVQQGQEQLARSVELQQEQMPELLQRIRRGEIHDGDVLIIIEGYLQYIYIYSNICTIDYRCRYFILYYRCNIIYVDICGYMWIYVDIMDIVDIE